MNFSKHLIITLISAFFLISCNSEEKERKNRHEEELKKQEATYNELIEQYSPKLLTEDFMTNKFSYELEEEYLHKTSACVVEILDVKRINDSEYQVFAKGDNLTSIITIDNTILTKILSIRSLYNKGKNEPFHHLNFIKFVFILKPNKFFKNFNLFKYVSDYYLLDGELEEYYVDLELDENGFLIEADGLDIMIATHIHHTID